MNDENLQAGAVVSEAERVLQKVDPRPFSPQAFEVTKQKIGEYIVALIAESVKISNRRKSDVVSAANVEQASDYLVTSSASRWFKHVGTVGGILLGASLSNFLSMTTSLQYSTIGIVISAALAIVGAFCVALHIGRTT